MATRTISSDELLLVVLRLLEQRPMSVRELFGEIDRLLGRRAPRAGDVPIALASLEAELLVKTGRSAEREEYRVTEAGRKAVARRADVAVLPGVSRPRLPRLGSRRSPQCEVEQAAILFTDVVRSTELLDRLGDEAAHEVRRRHFDLLRSALRDHGGREVKSLGDGLMVVFDSTQAAAAGALAMQRAVDGCDDPVQLRVGIAAGEMVREDDDYFGRPVVVAKRLCDAAAGGEVLVSGPARGLAAADPAIDHEQLEPLTLKGLSEPVTPTVLRAHQLAPAG
jgi:class 3 adenylate cyclase